MTRLSAMAISFLCLLITPTLAAPSGEFVRQLNAYLSGSRLNLLADGYKYKGHKIKGGTVVLTYQDGSDSAGKAAQQKATRNILKVICHHKIKSGAARNGMTFAMIVTNWNNTPQSTKAIDLADCP